MLRDVLRLREACDRVFRYGDYDMMAKLMTLSLDERIRAKFASTLRELASRCRVAVDVGAGTGLMTRAVLSSGIRADLIVLLDISIHGLIAAKRRFSNDVRVDAVCASAEMMPLRRGSADMIYSAYAMRHVNASRFIASTLSSLKERGVLGVLDFWRPSCELLRLALTIYLAVLVPLQSLISSPRNFIDYMIVWKSIQRVVRQDDLAKALVKHFDRVLLRTWAGSTFLMIYAVGPKRR